MSRGFLCKFVLSVPLVPHLDSAPGAPGRLLLAHIDLEHTPGPKSVLGGPVPQILVRNHSSHPSTQSRGPSSWGIGNRGSRRCLRGYPSLTDTRPGTSWRTTFFTRKHGRSEGFWWKWWEWKRDYPRTWCLLEWTGSLSATKDGGDFFLLNLPFPEKTRKSCRLL